MHPRIFVLALSTFAFGSGAFIFAGLLEQVAYDLGVPTGAAGQLQTAYVLTSALAGPPLAMLLGRFERKRILLTALGLAAGLNLICMHVHGFGELLGLRAMLGALAAVAGPSASAAAGALAPPGRRGSAIAIVTGGMTLAFLMGIPMGSVVGAAFGWRATFLLAAGLAALAFAGVAILLPRIEATVPQPGAMSSFRIGIPLWATTLLGFAANMSITTYIAPILRIQTGVVGAGVAPFQMLVGVGSILGLSLGARAADNDFGRTSVIFALAALACGAGLHLLEITGGAPPGWPTYLVVSLAILTGSTTLFSVGPVVQTRLIAAMPDAAPLALSLNASAASLGQAVGAALGGALLSGVGAWASPIASIGLALTALSVWVLGVRPPAPAAPRPDSGPSPA